MARPRCSRGDKSVSTSSRGRKRTGRQQPLRSEEEEEEKQRDESEVEQQVVVQQEVEDDEQQQRPAKRTVRGRRGSTGSMDEEEEEPLLSYDAGDQRHVGLGAVGGDEDEEDEEAEEDSEAEVDDLQSKQILDQLFKVSRTLIHTPSPEQSGSLLLLFLSLC